MSDPTSTPPSRSRLRREILRQAVAENLAETRASDSATAATGRRLRAAQNAKATTVAPRPTSRWLFGAALAAAVLVVAAGALLQSGGPAAPGSELLEAPASPAAGAVDPRPIREAGTAAAPSPASATPPPAPDLADLRFAAPRPIDPAVFPLAVKRVVIDPGHGGVDTGTAEFGLLEKDLTLDIALRLRDYLEDDGFEVELTREDDEFLDLRARAHLANELRADLFLSIHINWIPRAGARGVETYYLGAAEDPALEAFARRENRDSGYSLADMQELLESIYTDVRQDASRRLAERIQRSLYTALRPENPQLVDRGVKSAPFVVLVATRMPAILAEVSSLSDRGEAEFLEKPLYRDHIARALSRGVRKYADEVHQTETKGS